MPPLISPSLDAALSYAARGWAVFPVKPDKHPLTAHGFMDAATEPERIRGLWRNGAGVAVATGARSGLVVVDFDPRNGSDATLRDLERKHGPMPATVAARTGGGGEHRYFRHPGGHVKSLAGALGPGVDLKADGGYVVAPPSSHESGGSYAWIVEHDPDSIELASLPGWILAAVRRTGDTAPKVTPSVVLDGLSEGERNTALHRYACRLRNQVSEREAVVLLAAAMRACTPPYTDETAEDLVARVWKTYPDPPEAPPHPAETEDPGWRTRGGSGSKADPAALLQNIVGAIDLQTRVFQPVRWIIPGILPQGLAILGGRPKVGKSRLSLAFGVAVASGGYALGSVKVEPGAVLCLALEDGLRRLKERIGQLTGPDPFPAGLDLVPMGGWKPLPDGGLDALRLWLEANPDARLVVIDTLAKVRPASARNEDSYLRDTLLLAPLLELAEKHNVCILLVTHLRKTSLSEGDWLEAIHGSIGQAGAADAVLCLDRARHKQEGILRGTGRDMPADFALSLESDPAIGGWRLIGPADVHQLSQERQEILAILAGAPAPMSPKAIAATCGKSEGSVRQLVWKMNKDALLVVDKRGRYSLPETLHVQ